MNFNIPPNETPEGSSVRRKRGQTSFYNSSDYSVKPKRKIESINNTFTIRTETQPRPIPLNNHAFKISTHSSVEDARSILERKTKSFSPKNSPKFPPSDVRRSSEERKAKSISPKAEKTLSHLDTRSIERKEEQPIFPMAEALSHPEARRTSLERKVKSISPMNYDEENNSFEMLIDNMETLSSKRDDKYNRSRPRLKLKKSSKKQKKETDVWEGIQPHEEEILKISLMDINDRFRRVNPQF